MKFTRFSILIAFVITALLLCSHTWSEEAGKGVPAKDSYDILHRNTQILSLSAVAGSFGETVQKAKTDLLENRRFFQAVFSDHISYAAMVALSVILSVVIGIAGVRKLNTRFAREQ